MADSTQQNAELRASLSPTTHPSILNPLLVGTNIKVFAPHAEAEYTSLITDAIASSRLNNGPKLVLSPELPSEYKHDLVGLLHMLHTHQQTFPPASPLAFVLDGGKKSRNYALTLRYGYQGLFPVTTTTTTSGFSRAWVASVESLATVLAQMPSTSTPWALLTASDYDIIPGCLSLADADATHLSQALAAADVVLFTHPPSPLVAGGDPDGVLGQLCGWVEEQMGSSEWEGWEEMDTEDALAVLEGAGVYGSGAGDARFIEVIGELARLSSKGILLVDERGCLVHFVEKPPLPALLALTKEGQILENIMFAALSRPTLDSLLDSFPEHLWGSYAFGFYNTLFAAPFMEKAAFVAKSPSLPEEVAGEIYSRAVAFFAALNVVVGSFGPGSIVSDMGEPRYYMESQLVRAFTPEGRIVAGLGPVPESGRLELTSSCTVDDAVDVDVSGLGPGSRVVCVDLTLSGSGQVRFVSSHGEGRVLVAHSRIHVPEGASLVIEIGPDGSALIIDCELSVAPGSNACIQGDPSILLAGLSEPSLSGQDLSGEIYATSLSFDVVEGLERHIVPLDVVANAKRVAMGGTSLLQDCVFASSFSFDFVQALSHRTTRP